MSKLPSEFKGKGLPEPDGEVTIEEITPEKLAGMQAQQMAKMKAVADLAKSNLGKFDLPKNARYLHYSLSGLPEPYESLDTNRLTLAHFCIQSLSILKDGRLFDVVKGREVRERMIKWIYNLKVTQKVGETTIEGFCGGTFMGNPFNDVFLPTGTPPSTPTSVHLAMTYCALLTLLTLGDDLSHVNAQDIMEGVKGLQNLDREGDGILYGSFKSHCEGSESDMRFNYCALTIERILWKILHPSTPYNGKDDTYINKTALVEFIKKSKGYDGGLALMPEQESHGGSFFTGLATLEIMGAVDEVFEDRDEPIEWGVMRQIGGMQGRRGKVEDTCYSYWVGGGLNILDGGSNLYLDKEPLHEYILKCQHPMYGGFGKAERSPPDVLHTFYSLSYLSLSGFDGEGLEDGLGEIDVVLGCAKETGDWIRDPDKSYSVLVKEKELRDLQALKAASSK
ncbi:hypothetical protein TrLO_g6367 [Triparma laevis f. longispina]|uniref:Prenyltransferase alpha-alpha toroid domain-containing protein n=2 Tax=Triparma laevis TaxID=1534972 RepID=A0A9W7C7C4_9STRA|nr:hypothetical protein TrLO_g6367 [Triparma laevis f. longispina]